MRQEVLFLETSGERYLLQGEVSGEKDGLLATPSGILGLLRNSPFLIAVLCFALAQSTKFVITYIDTKELRWERLIGSGGMPSAHSAFVTGLTVSVGIREGTSSSTFAVSLVLAFIVMYDAVGLRLHSGRHAAALNIIISELPHEHPINPTTFELLREQLGHTPQQVAAGCLLGTVVALLVQGALGSAAGVQSTHSQITQYA